MTTKNESKTYSAWILLLGTALLLGGCAQFGPRLVESGRTDYNKVLQRTGAREMLLNIVRARYGDRPLFLDVGSVSTSFSWNQGALANISGFRSGNPDGALEGNLAYQEQPTITYTPQGGADFVKNMLTPADLDTLIFLSNVGWGIDRLLRLLVNRMGGLPNAPTASGPTPRDAPAYATFKQVANSMRVLQQRQLLAFRYIQRNGKETPAMIIEEEAGDWPQTRKIRELLKLDPDTNIYPLDTNGARDRPLVLGIELRSLVESFFFLSHGVHVPTRDTRMGRVMVTRDEKGRAFDWGLVVGDLFNIRSQAQAPDNARVAVRYRNSWFYVDDSDLASKYTFLLMGQLSALLAGKTTRITPALTLPVHR